MLQKHIAQYSEEELDTWIRNLVADECPESMTLEYKAEQTFDSKSRLEIAKDISSFANTKGGVIIYGIPVRGIPDGAEEKVIPRTEYGIDAIQDFEIRLESALSDTVSPHLPDLWIRRVPISQRPGQLVYVVWHPESWLGPHMVQAASEQSYYRRGLRRTIKMVEPETGELGDPQGGIEQGEDYGIVSKPLWGIAIDGAKECLKLQVREGGDHFPRDPGKPDLREGAGLHNPLTDEPGPEGPDGAQVAVYSVLRKSLLLNLSKGVFGEAPLLLKVEDEGPYLVAPDRGGIGGEPLRGQEPIKVAHTASHGVYGLLAFTFGSGAEAVALNKS